MDRKHNIYFGPSSDKPIFLSHMKYKFILYTVDLAIYVYILFYKFILSCAGNYYNLVYIERAYRVAFTV